MASELAEAPHILVVDDDQRLRALLSRYLRDQGFRVTLAEHAADARAKLASLLFDLLIVDVMMPGQSGLDFVTWLRRHSPVPILMLTAMGETQDRIRGLEQGADDYLAKPFEPRELVLRLRTILRRAAETGRTPLVKLGDCEFDAARQELRRAGELVRLTASEAALLSALAARPGVALSREHLAELSPEAGTDRSVDVQVTRLRRKIEPDPREPRYLRTVRGRGYALWPD